MGGLSNWPDFNQFLSEVWGWGTEWAGGGVFGASNIVVGTNPPYGLADFLSFYPKYAGPPAVVTGALTDGSPLVTAIIVPPATAPANCFSAPIIAAGQLVTGNGIPANTTILSVQSITAITLSQNATISGTGQILIYTQPLVPLFVIGTYITLASASLVQNRWLDNWWVGMAYFVGHYLTLYLRSEGDSNTTAGAAAVAGLKTGITISSAGGNVSQALKAVPGLDDWSAWTQTNPGTLLATLAKGAGAGPLFLY